MPSKEQVTMVCNGCVGDFPKALSGAQKHYYFYVSCSKIMEGLNIHKSPIRHTRQAKALVPTLRRGNSCFDALASL